MRIVAGSARGRRLRVPRGRSVRPTADRVKESIFSMLESRYGCEGVAVLDLFAGSGNLGIEALSRGAAEAVFVETDARAAAAIRANLQAAGFSGEVLVMPAARAIASMRAHGRRFGGVFLDPPYDRGWVGPTLSALAGAALVHNDGWIIVEHGRDEEPAARVGALTRRDSRRYGDTRVTTFAVEPSEEDVDGVP
ncbi:MAG: 16S rRNA (guanine(966)-N(2))-methyltransferase RsmD [Deltaproteobacteria bacterium]|nr:16S rRNA (guanine(966)-N(2))-methyltransferase RsmD [Deltaproteobacteria bacterium]